MSPNDMRIRRTVTASSSQKLCTSSVANLTAAAITVSPTRTCTCRARIAGKPTSRDSAPATRRPSGAERLAPRSGHDRVLALPVAIDLDAAGAIRVEDEARAEPGKSAQVEHDL